MTRRVRSCVAVLSALVLLAVTAAPAAASNPRDISNAPPMFDLLVLRPLGFVSLVVGLFVFVPALAITMATRPHEIGKPIQFFIWRPIKYIWGEPLGGH